MGFWNNLWMKIFGTTEWLGLNVGFWVSMVAVVVVVVVMIVTFWSLKPLVGSNHTHDCHADDEEPEVETHKK